MDHSEEQRLFEQTLVGEYENEQSWAAISALRGDGSRAIFDHAGEWCVSDDPLKRARAASILSQLHRAPDSNEGVREPEFIFRDESYVLITRMLESEQVPMVLRSAIAALGQLHNSEAISLILDYSGHPDDEVRFSVAFTLGQLHDDPRSIAGLLKLTSDSDSEVRDWAVFGLGVLSNADSSEIREALLRCLMDEDEDVREEAAVGLGKRIDVRIVPVLRVMLDCAEPSIRVTEATSYLLGLEHDPPEWKIENYRAALESQFPIYEQ